MKQTKCVSVKVQKQLHVKVDNSLEYDANVEKVCDKIYGKKKDVIKLIRKRNFKTFSQVVL